MSEHKGDRTPAEGDLRSPHGSPDSLAAPKAFVDPVFVDPAVSEVQREVALAVVAPQVPRSDVVIMMQAPSEDHLNVIGHSFLRDRKFYLWDALRQQYPQWKPRISNLNLPGATLEGLDFSHTHFENFSAPGANLKNSNLSCVYLVGADLAGADLGGSNCEGAHMSRIKLSGGKLNGAMLRNTDLSHALLIGVDMIHIRDIEDCNLDAANLSGVNAIGTDLSKAKITLDTIRTGMVTNEEQLPGVPADWGRRTRKIRIFGVDICEIG